MLATTSTQKMFQRQLPADKRTGLHHRPAVRFRRLHFQQMHLKPSVAQLYRFAVVIFLATSFHCLAQENQNLVLDDKGRLSIGGKPFRGMG